MSNQNIYDNQGRRRLLSIGIGNSKSSEDCKEKVGHDHSKTVMLFYCLEVERQ